MKKCVLLVALLCVGFLFVGCSKDKETTSSNSSSSSTKTTSKTTQTVDPELLAIEKGLSYEIVENTTGKQVKVAVISVNNNPFWMDVVQGAEDIQKVMAQDKYNCKVDLITVEDFDGQIFSDTIKTCIVKEYDVITTVGVADSIVPAINEAIDAGIEVYTFNSDTGKESKRVAFHGQDLYAAGGVAAQTLVDMIDGEGKVAIITGLFSVNAHELRRQGGIEVFNTYPNIEIIGEVESRDSNDEAYSQTKDFLTAHPDLQGIYVTAGGQIGAAKVLKELGLTDQVALVCFDYMDEVIDGIYDGSIDATIGQDPYGQGANPVIFGYNKVITGTTQYTGNVWTKMDVVTIDNIQEFFPR